MEGTFMGSGSHETRYPPQVMIIKEFFRQDKLRSAKKRETVLHPDIRGSSSVPCCRRRFNRWPEHEPSDAASEAVEKMLIFDPHHPPTQLRQPNMVLVIEFDGMDSLR